MICDVTECNNNITLNNRKQGIDIYQMKLTDFVVLNCPAEYCSAEYRPTELSWIFSCWILSC